MCSYKGGPGKVQVPEFVAAAIPSLKKYAGEGGTQKTFLAEVIASNPEEYLGKPYIDYFFQDKPQSADLVFMIKVLSVRTSLSI